MPTKAPKVTRKKITDYIPDGHNANVGSERGLQMLEQSLNQDGAGRSIVADKDGRIPAGNKTLEAAMNAGIEDVIEIETDGTALIVHKRSDWNLDDPTGAARRYAYRDNRVSEVSLNWDANVIASDIEAGLDLSGMWTGGEIDYLLHPTLAYGENERRLNPDENLDIFLDATIKQIVLYFDNEQFEDVIKRLAIIRQREGVDNNTEAFLKILSVYEQTTG